MYMNPELRKKTWPWYWPSYSRRLTPEGRKLLEDCGVAAGDMDSHVHRVRDQAWEVYPFPCIGEFWFLEFGITHHPQFQDVLDVLRGGPTQTVPNGRNFMQHNEAGTDAVVSKVLKAPTSRRLLDLGTCVGQDLRALRAAGAPLDTLYGTDIFPGFEAVGHALFLDQAAFGRNFFAADVFDDSPGAPLNITAGHWDVVTITMFFHQFDEQTGLKIATRVIPLLKQISGSMIIGNNTGETVAREIPLVAPFTEDGKSKAVFRHSRESMQAMWEKAIDQNEQDQDSADRNSRWSVWCDYDEKFTAQREEEEKAKVSDPRFFTGGKQRRVMFSVRRL